jgi:two-component system sensor histidine kinase/response regulator
MPANILIVDDTPENLTVLRDILTREGHKVRPVLQGELALRIARIEPPDLILLDIIMPGLSGYQTCERLKADPLTAACPVLFISALDAVGDKVRGFQAGGLDYITKPFQVEEVLARVRTHLALSAAQRQLREQNAQLEEAARLRADMDRLLRHDLRGPLGNILAFSELVQRATQNGQPEVAEHARVIGSAAYALLSMVHSSFDLVKMERGDYVVQAQAFDLAELLSQLLREMAPLAADRQLRLTPQLPPPPTGWVLGEALLARSLFHNLLRNAIEASPPGASITLRLWVEAPNRPSAQNPKNPQNAQVVVSLRNAGEVPADIRSRFFEKYVTSGKPQGSGLGTYSARLMAHAQGGSIGLDSSEPGFTQLWVKLPAAAAPFVAPSVAPSVPDSALNSAVAAEANHAAAAAAPCTRLLVADDDPAIHRYLAHTLPADLFTHSVYDGQQALQTLLQQLPDQRPDQPQEQPLDQPFDHALIDLQMPGLDGLAVAERYTQACRRHPAHQACTLIALSAHSDAATQQRCLSAGFAHVLTKPPSVPALLALLGLGAAGELAQALHIDQALQPLMAGFLQSRQTELAVLAQAIEQGQAAQVASVAHKLQGSLAMYGFAAASQCAAGIEQLAHHDLRQAAVLLQDLRHHLATTPIHYV